MNPMILVLVCALPLIFLYVVWALEMYAVSRPAVLLAAFGWGVAAFFLAYGLHNALPYNTNTIRLLIAPISEEVLKALFLLGIARQLRYAVDGAVYGFAVGIGFAVVENLFYAADVAAGTALARVLSVSLMHAFTTSVLGTFMGLAVYKGWRGRRLHLLVGLVGGITVHMAYNRLVAQLEGAALLMAAFVMGLGGVLTLILLIQQALRQEKRTIHDYLQDSLSPGELSAALNPQDVAAAIVQQAQGELDANRLQLVQQYVTLQAQRGILQKTQKLNQRARFATTLDRDLRAVEQQLKALRSAMGLYTWVWLRQILPSDESELWAQLNSEIDQPIVSLLVQLTRSQAAISPDELRLRIGLLRAAQLFDSLPDDDLEDLALLLRQAVYRFDEVVIHQGEATTDLFFVAEGQLIASTHDPVRQAETILYTYTECDHFGELSMLSEASHPATVTCLAEAVLYRLSRADFLTLIYAKPQVAVAMMRELVEEIQQRTRLVDWMRSTSALEL
ncbi:MAG: hypothetical protein OHK0046_22450 [Anaerolineae bacterium]